MKKFKGKITVILGVIAVLLLALSSWYSIVFNDWRLVSPMEFSAYQFQVKDLPMLASLALFGLYVLYLFALLIGAIDANRQREKATRTTRKLNPKLGCWGSSALPASWAFGAIAWIRPSFPSCFSCSSAFSASSTRAKCPTLLWTSGLRRTAAAPS